MTDVKSTINHKIKIRESVINYVSDSYLLLIHNSCKIDRLRLHTTLSSVPLICHLRGMMYLGLQLITLRSWQQEIMLENTRIA